MKFLSGLIFMVTLFPLIINAQINNPRNLSFDWKTDTLKSEIDLSELTMVLPRGSFSKIDFPEFINHEEGLQEFYKHEPVISIEINGKAKAYPLNMLTMHEMSNDTLGGIPILPTYCPLCNSSLVFNRKIETPEGYERILEFEVSGMLRFSDMVMGDKETSTLWQQLTGVGIVGENAGVQLEVLPSQVISVDEFFNRYPEGQILSSKTNTSAEDNYGNNPYIGYDKEDGKPYSRFFDHSTISDKLPPMERIVNIRSLTASKIYPFSLLKKEKVVNDHFEGIDLVLFFKDGSVSILDKAEIAKSKAIGSATAFSAILEGKKLTFSYNKGSIVDDQSKSRWDITGYCHSGSMEGKQLEKLVHSNHFAFAWLNFHPESEVYAGK